eukprot:CAMPEP_0172182978 /NCGR_PEP_ID=MMETSP1050-20130122/18713_1 /TAXON_ID=233186 /ORGANISM="Cryptomonas curvata, Strain CCAP979/52" /LENGTH=109 /DNA_ID=CAMNT_0012856511 /DNA_START=68 /DNA_END=394 /DNA_ORIENTATION=+
MTTTSTSTLLTPAASTKVTLSELMPKKAADATAAAAAAAAAATGCHAWRLFLTVIVLQWSNFPMPIQRQESVKTRQNWSRPAQGSQYSAQPRKDSRLTCEYVQLECESN